MDPSNPDLGHCHRQRHPQQAFYDHVIVQVQASHNLLVASTANAEYAITLSKVTTLQLGAVQHELMPYMKPPPDTCRGVIHGLDSDITPDTLANLLQANKPLLLHARLMGRTTSALLTFQGPHVPFYVKVGSILYRCRPFRRTVQVCQLCGDTGHRQDVCPNPDNPKCPSCGLSNPATGHPCSPMCKLCSLPHTTASKDCPKKLIPGLPVNKPRIPSGEPAPAQVVDLQQVSWPTIVSRSPTAHSYPTLPTRPTTTTPTTSPSAPTTTTRPTTTTPTTTPTSPAPTAIEQLLAEIKQQNAAMLARIEALETANRLTQQPPKQIPPPELVSPSPPPLTAGLAAAILDEKIQTQVIPMVEKHIATALLTLNKTVTDTADTLLRLTDSITQRLTALEQASPAALTPQHKKPKISPLYDTHLAATTALPTEDD